jgi:DNA mismatch endonuclease (patch repair protein)
MADIFSKAKRSEVMSRIRSRGNRDTEGAMVLLLRAAGITGWRRHQEVRIPIYDLRGGQEKAGTGVAVRGSGRMKKGEGADLRIRIYDLRIGSKKTRPFRVRPDFVWRRERVALFVDGCFWHGCPWHGTKPASNKVFWRTKLARNRERDRLVSRTLRRAGWQVVRVWEHVLPKAAREAGELARLLKKIGEALKG